MAWMPLPAYQMPGNAMLNFQPVTDQLNAMVAQAYRERQQRLAENQDTRAAEMHPLSMDYQRAQTAGLVGAENRAQEMQPLQMRQGEANVGLTRAQTGQANAAAGLTGVQTQLARDVMPYQVIQQYWAAQRPPNQNDLVSGILGVPVQQAPAPQAPWPTRYAGPQPQAPAQQAQPQQQPQFGGTPGGLSINPNGQSWQPTGGGMPSANAAPAARPQQPNANPWAQFPQQAAIAAGLATGQLQQPAAQMLAAGPEWMGVPDAIRNHASTQAAAAAQAAQTAQATMANIDRLAEIAPQAYVGAGAAARTNVANVLQSLGVSPQWVLNNQSLSATQLLQQGLAQFIGTEAEKYKPISNSDIAFIQSTVANPSMTRDALTQALQVARRVAQRQAVYEEARAQLLLRDPNAAARLPGLMARVLEAFPQAQPAAGGATQGVAAPQPQAGQPQSQAPAAASTAGGSASWRRMDSQGQAAAIQMLLQDPSPARRQQFAETFGNDVLVTTLRLRHGGLR